MRQAHLTTDTAKHRRSGIFSIEVAMTLPILLLMLMAVFEFSLLFFARGSVVQASRVAARAACVHGVDSAQIEHDARAVLDPRMRDVADIDVRHPEDDPDLVAVTVRVPMDVASPDLLWPVGFSLDGRNLVSETRMLKE